MDVLKRTLKGILKEGYVLTEASVQIPLSDTGAKFVPVDLGVLQEYVNNRDVISSLLTTKVSTTLNVVQSSTVYEHKFSASVMCIFILASKGYALTQASVSGMNDQAIASLWRTLYLCSMAETEASRWIKANMQGRTRNVFCKLRGLEETTMRIETGRLPEELVDALANDDFKLKTPQGNTALLCRHESLNRLECVLRIMCLD